jgi:hypothetical protein
MITMSQSTIDENEEILIEKGEDFLKTAKALSEVIAGLPLDYEQNQRLIDSIMEHVDAGRVDAFGQGMRYVIERIDAAANPTPGLPS